MSATGIDTAAVLASEELHESGLFPRRPVAFVRGEGALLFDAEGHEYLDCAAGHGVANLGHAHPRVTAAIVNQAGRLVTATAGQPNEKRAELLERLSAFVPAPLGRWFLCNSGTEANEGAIKFARIATGRTDVLAFQRGFHGRTFGALSATHEPKYRTPFEPLVPGFAHAPFDDLERAAELVTDGTALVLVEVVQGEGGVRPASPEFLRGLRELCDARGALLAIDEVQTGFGRTGRRFAFEHSGVEPDLLCLGKAIGGGVPMGAVGFGERVGKLSVGVHGSTFGGNPLACAAACAVIGAMEEERIPERAAELGAWLMNRLRELRSPLVREVRGLGLLIGVELRGRVAPVLQGLFERRVLALPAGVNVLRLLPPLVISKEELERAVAAIAEALDEVASSKEA